MRLLRPCLADKGLLLETEEEAAHAGLVAEAHLCLGVEVAHVARQLPLRPRGLLARLLRSSLSLPVLVFVCVGVCV